MMCLLIVHALLLSLVSWAYAEPSAHGSGKNAGRRAERQAAPVSKTQPAGNTTVAKRSETGSKKDDKYYRVKAGETLYGIGVATGIGYQKLAEWNHLPASYLIKAGQNLQLFPPSNISVKPVDQNSTTSNKSKPISPVSKAKRTTSITTTALPDSMSETRSTKSGKYYQVKAGETLYGIGVATGIGYQKLAEWNHLPASYLIMAGQSLQLFPPSNISVKPVDQNSTTSNKSKPISPVSKAKRTTSITTTALPDSISVTPLAAAKKRKPVQSSSNGNSKKTPNLPAVTKNSNNSSVNSAAEPEIVANKKSVDANKPVERAAKKIKNLGISSRNRKVLKLNFQWPIKGIVLKNASRSSVKGVDIASRQDRQKVKAAESGKVVYQGPGLQGYKNLIVIKHNDDYLTVYANNSRLLVKEGQKVSKGQAIAEILAAGGQQKPLHFEIRKNGRALQALSILPKR